MREDQMSKLDQGLVTFSAFGAGGGWVWPPDFDIPGNPKTDYTHHITTWSLRIFRPSYGLVTSASWDTECPQGIFNTQADMSFKVFIYYFFTLFRKARA